MTGALTAQQEAALRGLAENGVLATWQHDAVRAALTTQDRVGVKRNEILTYLGGGLVLVGAALTVATSWEDMGHAMRSLVLISATAGLFVAALLVSHHTGRASQRITAALFALAATVSALAAGTTATAQEGAWAASVALVLSVAAYAYLPSLPCLAVASASAFALVVDLTLIDAGAEPRLVAAALVALGVVWGALTAVDLVRPAWAGYGIAVITGLIGAQLAVDNVDGTTWAYALTAGIAVFCFAAYSRHHHPALLAGGVIGTAIAIPEALWDWTGGSVGAAASVLIAGAILLGFGALDLWRRPRPHTRSARQADPGSPQRGQAVH